MKVKNTREMLSCTYINMKCKNHASKHQVHLSKQFKEQEMIMLIILITKILIELFLEVYKNDVLGILLSFLVMCFTRIT